VQRALLIYDSKYGSTETMVKQMALILGPSRYCRPAEFREEYRSFDLIVIGAPLYRESLPAALMDFVAANYSWLRSKRVALFCTCLSQEQGTRQLRSLGSMIGNHVLALRAMGGRLDLERLDVQDSADIAAVCRQIGVPLSNVDLNDANELVEFALGLKALKDEGDRPMPAELLQAAIEDFLTSHNTCTLSTGSGSRVRGTPIEYSYQEGRLYLLTEGGEKFANLLLNPNVAVTMYEPYQGMNRLAGLQLSGQATLIDRGSEEYGRALHLRGISPARVAALPILLNVVRIQLDRAEFLNSRVQEMGYGMRQVYRFATSSGR
jgi:menaquinone-dependent protoporphyrinogen IX oxidase/uncharacterized protein YhbP (UPF0306 family)